MNNENDIARIVGYLGTIGEYISSKEDANVSPEELKEAYLNAASKVQQYENELKALKLSRKDGMYLNLIRDAFRFTRKSLIAASKGNMTQAKILMFKANTKPTEYAYKKAKSKGPNG